MALGELYVDESLLIEGDDLRGVLAGVVRNADGAPGAAGWLRLRKLANRLGAARRNPQAPYDLPSAIHDLFLDGDRRHSCSNFRSPADTLRQKAAHIARKLLIEPGMRVLDIGCGWGGLARTLARDRGARVVGVTLSEEQLALATRRRAEAGLSAQVEVRLQDYRKVAGTFRVVPVGMFEHVGMRLCDLACWRLHCALTLGHWLERFSARAEEARALQGALFVRLWRFYLAACEATFRLGRQDVWQVQLVRRPDAVPITRDYLCREGAGDLRRAAG